MTQILAVILKIMYYLSTDIFIGFRAIKTLGLDTKFVTLGPLEKYLKTHSKVISDFGRHLGFLKMLKGERSTPTWIFIPGPHRKIIWREKNFTSKKPGWPPWLLDYYFSSKPFVTKLISWIYLVRLFNWVSCKRKLIWKVLDISVF